MIKKLIFLLILFVSPLFANDALAECYKVDFNANGGVSDGLLTTAYYNPSTDNPSNAGWYSDSSCARRVNVIAFLPTRKGYQLRGFWAAQLDDVSANDATPGLFVSNNGDVKQTIPKFGATLFAAWAQDCENNCPLTIGEDGSVTYNSQPSNPDCYTVTLDTNNGIFSGKFNDNKLYSMGGNWYTDSMCANEYTGTTELVPSRTGYVFRGFYNSILPDISETTTAANTSSNLCITKNGDATENCRILEPITIYAAWAQDCTVPSNGTCDVTAGTDGGVDYTTSCATGYEPQQDQNTATPSCTRGLECYKIAFDYNGGTSMAAQPSIYKQQGSAGFFSDANCTTPMTTVPILSLPTRTGYTLRGFYNTDLADVSINASNGNLYATNTGVLTPFATSWTITDGNSTLYAAWAENCTTPANGTCKLEIDGGTGAATYNASCNSGYTLSNGGTANPTCTSNCKVITLKYQNQNSQNNIEVKTISHNGTNWCSDSSCGRCGALFIDLFKRPSDDALPAYFSTGDTTTNYTLINTGSVKEINDSNTAYTCSYTNSELNCNVSPSTTTLYAYVFVAPNLAGAVSGGGLLSFSTVATSSKKTVTVSYKSATCSDAATVHFYGIKGDGTYDSVGTAKFYYDTEKWGNSSGTIKTNFAGLGITNSFTNSVTVNGTRYPKGLSAYRAAWVGGEPRTQPTDMIITETTGIVSPDDNPYDIFVTGGANTLPNISAELFSTAVPGSAKNVYYVLLYAANCVDPQGTVNHSTCELTITPNGGAYYKNQCLSGYEIENMGTDTLPTTAITPVVVDINNTCEI